MYEIILIDKMFSKKFSVLTVKNSKSNFCYENSIVSYVITGELKI